ncbi:hypothetical protein DYB32_008695 [Aphanomyces invadans]|uniref:Uncharacterized protein n=1 Tax=Aphanomyces invadans TaxID=157072 RepID=A0A3R7A3Y3_9STRA|nr:hypothetical protein DYB32_008695 [Aphanomyces invadans]
MARSIWLAGWMVLVSVATAAELPCTPKDVQPIVPFYSKCKAESQLNLTNPSDAANMCTFPACRAYVRSFALLNCTSDGRSNKVAAHICDPFTPRLVDTPFAPTRVDQPPCTMDDLRPLTLIQVKCASLSNIPSIANLTNATALATYCSIPTCAASAKQHATLMCTINGAPASAFATLCNNATTASTAPVALPMTTASTTVNECTATSLPADLVAAQNTCLRVAGLIAPPTTNIIMDSLCQYSECTRMFALYGSLTCMLNDEPASLVAQTCVGTKAPTSTVASPLPAPSPAPTPVLSFMATLGMLVAAVMLM